MSSLVLAACGLLACSAIGGDPQSPEAKGFKGPESCGVCHPRHYQEWRGSAHAYSAVDPLVDALNRRALAETGGKIGSFCVSCHVPLGARSGELAPTFEIAKASPLALGGVSCEVCHRAEPPAAGKPIANASFEMTSSNVFYGRLENPTSTPAHETASSEFLGRSEFCGSCHDVLHGSALIEKSFAQWSASVHRERESQCQTCHMLRYAGQAAVGGPYRETLHRHNFPAVSVPLVKFPNHGYQSEQVKEFLRTAARLSVFVPEAAPAGGELAFTVRVKNSGAGHNLPTGLANERQMWIEATVADENGAVLFQSGALDANGDLRDHHSELAPGSDPWLFSFSDRFLNDEGKEVPFVFLASKVDERSLKPLEERGAVYRMPLDRSMEGQRVVVRVRLLFRSFPPHVVRELGLPELAQSLQVLEVDTYSSPGIRVVEEMPRRTEYRVPGDFPAIQAAIDALRDGDQITVNPGEYALTRSLDFRGKALRIIGAAGFEKTTLRYAGGASEKDASLVVFRSGEGPGATLEGFTITKGRGVEIDGERRGGGIYTSRSSPTVIRCRIVACEAAGGLGGGACCDGGAPAFVGNEFFDCRAERGGGLAVIRVADGAELRLDGGAFRANVARQGGALYLGRDARASLRRFEAAGNRALAEGGGLYAEDNAGWAIDHATLVFHHAESGPAALFVGSRKPGAVSNSILWSNEPPGGDAVFAWSIVDCDPPPTNRNVFPIFADPTGKWLDAGKRWVQGDYRLLLDSPAIDSGDPDSPADPDDTRTDIGAYFFEQPRRAFVRGDVDGDGAIRVNDLLPLARFLFSKEEIPCRDAADLDDNGRVDPLDAVSLALSLFTGEPSPAPPAGACGFDPTPGDGLSCDKKAKPCLGYGS